MVTRPACQALPLAQRERVPLQNSAGTRGVGRPQSSPSIGLWWELGLCAALQKRGEARATRCFQGDTARRAGLGWGWGALALPTKSDGH